MSPLPFFSCYQTPSFCLPQQATTTRSPVHRSANMSSPTTTMASHAPCHVHAAASSVGKGSPHLSRVLPAPPGGEIALFSRYKKSLKKLIVFGFLKGGLQRYIGFFVDKSYY